MLVYYVKCPIFIKKKKIMSHAKKNRKVWLVLKEKDSQWKLTEWAKRLDLAEKAFKAAYKIIQRTQGNCVLNI